MTLPKMVLLLSLLLVFPSLSFSQSSQPANLSNPKDWHLIQKKEFPSYRVEVWMKENPKLPLGIEASSAKIFNKQGRLLAEEKNLILEADPKQNVEAWTTGQMLDLDGDGLEDLLLKGYSGGVHCCYQLQLYSLGKTLKKLGNLSLKDCGDKVELRDLNQDRVPELITCTSDFTTFKTIPYSESPFPPQVYSLQKGGYQNTSALYPKIFEEDATKLKAEIAKEGFDPSKILQAVLDELLLGKENEAWQTFNQFYTAANQDKVRVELQEKWSSYKEAATLQGVR